MPAPPRPIAEFRGKAVVAKYFAQRRDIWPAQRRGDDVDDEELGCAADDIDARVRMTTRAWCEASFFEIGAEVGRILAAAASSRMGNDNTAAAADGRPRAVISGFCGVGVDAIAIATSPDIDFVICVDNDERCIAALSANAAVYGVAHKIRTIVGDIYVEETTARIKRVLASLSASSSGGGGGGGGGGALIGAHLSPPWGGTGYLYRVATAAGAPPLSNPHPSPTATTTPYFVSAFDLAAGWGTPNVAVYLPRNVLWAELTRQAQRAFCCRGDGGSAAAPTIGVLEHALRFNGKVKGVTVLTGALVDAAQHGRDSRSRCERPPKAHRSESRDDAAGTPDLVAPQRPFASTRRGQVAAAEGGSSRR
jgi:hypothetical protein